MKAVVLLSGGLDSSTCTALAIREYGRKQVSALTLCYGQKHYLRETRAAKEVAAYFGILQQTFCLPSFPFVGFGSTLIDSDQPNPEMTYEEIQKAQGVSPTYVPFRNGVLLSLATALALRGGAEFLYFGAHSEDARNWAYPDCTPEFIGAMANAIYVGTYHKVRLVTPLQWLTKADIVRADTKSLGGVGVPFGLTYSCYNGREKHCGKCSTCVSRIEAFRKSHITDTAQYEIEVDWDA